MKATAVLFALFFLFASTLADDVENLQQFYNGVFAQGGLPNPTTILDCYNSSSATLTMQSLGTLLQQVANKNFFGALKTMKIYYHEAPSSINTCLQKNDEFLQLYHAYDTQNFTCLQLLARFGQYSLVHSNDLVNLDSIANDRFVAGNYTGAGQQVGVMYQTAVSEGAADEVFEQLVQNVFSEEFAQTAFPLSFKRPSQRSFRAGF